MKLDQPDPSNRDIGQFLQPQKPMFTEVDFMLALDVIEESCSPWSSNCVLVRKGEKSRVCLDSRAVHKVTVKDAYPLPHIDGGMIYE